MLTTSLLLISTHGLFPILLCWFLGVGTIAGTCLYTRRRLRRHDAR